MQEQQQNFQGEAELNWIGEIVQNYIARQDAPMQKIAGPNAEAAFKKLAELLKQFPVPAEAATQE